jgi:hypothetical protein
MRACASASVFVSSIDSGERVMYVPIIGSVFMVASRGL